jgi:hypothetical protein
MIDMKHTIIYLAAGLLSAAAMLTSCDYRLDDDNSGSIRFTAEAVSFAQPGVRTKATPVNTVPAFTDTYTSFKVNAYKGTTAKFTGGTSTYSSGEWNLTATDVKWWPDETLDFYALAFPETTPPMITLADEMVVIPSTKTAIFDYTFSPSASATGENTPDIMFGYYSGTGIASGGKRIAPLTFYHPFAAVKFKAGADLVGATVNSITITNVANGGTCTIAASNLAGNSAISWTLDSGHINYSNSYTAAAITAADQQIGTDDQTFILIPQTLGATAKLEVSLTITDEGVSTDVTLEASLENVVLEAGKILTFTINYADISISVIEPEGMIIPWETIAAVHINDPQLVPKYAYLPTGTAFNNALTLLANGRSITKITFSRFGSVDDTTPDTVQIQEEANENHPEGEIIYAHYNNGEITITTHANTIYLNADCSKMFKNMTGLADITWGNFFDSSLLANTSEMFMGCTALTVMDVSGVLVTTNVTNMSHMFDGCTGLVRLNLAFSTANALDLSFMFHDCSSLIVPPMSVNASNATTFESMYENCTGFDSMQMGNITSATNLRNLFKNCFTRKIELLGSPFTWPTLDDNLHAEGMFLNAIREGGFINGLQEAPHAWLVEHADLDPAVIYYQ